MNYGRSTNTIIPITNTRHVVEAVKWMRRQWFEQPQQSQPPHRQVAVVALVVDDLRNHHVVQRLQPNERRQSKRMSSIQIHYHNHRPMAISRAAIYCRTASCSIRLPTQTTVQHIIRSTATTTTIIPATTDNSNWKRTTAMHTMVIHSTMVNVNNRHVRLRRVI